MYRRRNECFGKIYKFESCQSKQCKNDTALRLAKGQSLNQTERQRISSNYDENNYRLQQILN